MFRISRLAAGAYSHRMRTQASPGIAEFFDLTLWFEWFSGLDRGFAFLLLLPLVVAAVGLWAHFRDPDRE